MGDKAGAWFMVPWNITLRGGKKYKAGVKFYEEVDAMELRRCSGTRELTKAEARRAQAIAEAEAMIVDANAEFDETDEGKAEKAAEGAEEEAEAPIPEAKPQPDELDSLTKANLIAIAKDKGIEVSKRMNKGEIAAAIRDAS